MISWFDLLALGLTIFILLRGTLGGFARTGMDVLALVSGVFVGRWFLVDFVIPWLRTVPSILYTPFFVVSWLVSYLLLGFLFRLILRLVKIEFLPPIEQAGGGVMGIAKVFVILGILVELAAWVPVERGVFESSYAYRAIKPLWSTLPMLHLSSLPIPASKTSPSLIPNIDKLQKEVTKILPEIPKVLQIPPTPAR